jgi:hypothetical protein
MINRLIEITVSSFRTELQKIVFFRKVMHKNATKPNGVALNMFCEREIFKVRRKVIHRLVEPGSKSEMGK